VGITIASEFSWFHLLSIDVIEGQNLVPFYHSCLAVVIILTGALAARLALSRKFAKHKDSRQALVPEANLRPQNVFELLIEFLWGMFKQELGAAKAKRFFPLLGTLFIYILVCNLMGLVPGFLPSTANINTNIGMAVAVFLVYNISGLIYNGVGYFKHFLGPVLWLAPLMLVLEVVGHLFRNVSLSMRLYGNMFGDHTVLSIFMFDLPSQTSSLLAYGIPVIFLGLGAFVCTVQAFVFTLLSMVYISQATAHEH